MSRLAMGALAPLVLVAALAGCGKYGPPVRHKEAVPTPAAATPPAPPAAQPPAQSPAQPPAAAPVAPGGAAPDDSQPKSQEPKP